MNAIKFFFWISAVFFFCGQSHAQSKRPQTPLPPFSYKSEEVVFYNTADSAKLSGTLTLPDKKGKFPAVVLITGSGIQNRDEEILQHKPFLVIADHLTRNGFAVLRFDDRGIGGSSLGKGDLTTESNSRDVMAAVNYLLGRKEINKKQIGLIGHSEGGCIAFLLASRQKEIAFIVSLAGAGVGGDQVLLSQQEIAFRAMGYKDSIIQNLLQVNREYFEIVKASKAMDEDFKSAMLHWLKSRSPGVDESLLLKQSKHLFVPWMYEFIRYNPATDICHVKIPVLAINGTKDTQVVSSLNLPAIENALKQAGNTRYKIVEPEGLNHLFQHCQTGNVNEYNQIEETFAPEVLDIITEWLVKDVLKQSNR